VTKAKAAKACSVKYLVVQRMFTLATELGKDATDYRLWEEFVALGYQLGLDVSPPDPAVQAALDDHGLVIRPFIDTEPDLTPAEVDRLARTE
jgi:hypothetical protein